MLRTNKTRWQLRIVALIIFLLGATAGVLAPRVFQNWFGPRRGEERFERMLDRMQVSDEQKVQVRQILAESRSRFDELRRQSEPHEQQIRRQTDERLQMVLTSAQWQQFQQMMAERRRHGRGRRGTSAGPPAPASSER